MDGVAGNWRFVRSFWAHERHLLLITGVAALAALGQTAGLAGAVALFSARYAVECLPQTFVFACVVTIPGVLLCAVLVGSTPIAKMRAPEALHRRSERPMHWQ